MSVVKAKLIGFAIRNCQGGHSSTESVVSGILYLGKAAVRRICDFVISIFSIT